VIPLSSLSVSMAYRMLLQLTVDLRVQRWRHCIVLPTLLTLMLRWLMTQSGEVIARSVLGLIWQQVKWSNSKKCLYWQLVVWWHPNISPPP
jgi:hypothetical protein